MSTRLQFWALGQGGWKVFDSSGGFRLPDGSVLSPDAAAVRLDRWQALTPEQRRDFPPLCPDLVVELVSASDEGPAAAKPCAARWSSTSPTAPGWTGCCFRSSGRDARGCSSSSGRAER